MSEQDEEYNVAIIYGALMRPPMLWGIPYNFLPIAGFIAALLTVAFNPLVGLGSLLPLWLMGYIVGKTDPDGFSVYQMYYQSHFADNKLTAKESFTIYGAC